MTRTAFEQQLVQIQGDMLALAGMVERAIDALYDQVYRELVTYMVNDPKTIERATHLTWVAHNLERIADRVTNICERVVYLVEGRIEELNVSKY